MSRYHLCRAVKQHTGITPYQLLLQSRVAYAQNVLTMTTLSAGEIDEQSGFENTMVFANTFKKHTCLTPGAFPKR